MNAVERHHTAPDAADSAYADAGAHLAGVRLLLDLRLHRQVLRWRAGHHPEAGEDELLGLYVSDREIDALLDGLYAAHRPAGGPPDGAPPDGGPPDGGPSDDAPDGAPTQGPIATLDRLLADAEAVHLARRRAARDAGVDLPLERLGERLGLDAFALGAVTLALAPELDRRYERLFAYLNDDAACRLPSVDLALSLYADGDRQRLAHAAFRPDAPLRRLGLLELVAPPAAAGLLACGLRLDPAIAAFVTGAGSADAGTAADGVSDPAVPFLRRLPARAAAPILAPGSARRLDALAAHLTDDEDAPLIAVQGRDADAAEQAAAFLAHAAGRDALVVLDLAGSAGATAMGTGAPTPPDGHDPAAAIAGLALAERAARLDHAALALRLDRPRGDRPADDDPALAALLAACARLPMPFFLLAEPDRALPLPPAPLLRLALEPADGATRARMWHAELAGTALAGEAATCTAASGSGAADHRGLAAELADRFRLGSSAIRAAAAEARAETRLAGHGMPDRSALVAASRAQTAGRLDGLAERIESIHDWDDLVLPAATKDALATLERWARHRGTVYRDWAFARRIMVGRGMTALFTGPSGTGKTMAAGILARRLELDLYRVDLSSVVSKYIGETEKNLSRIFDCAEAANAVLFFDEADALFGKRSEVKDAHDRYANIEVSYLLQRMESYAGIALLASNFRDNLDAAFARRIHLQVAFPCPQAADRERIWRRLLTAEVPQDADVDLGFIARSFALTGGVIKNCALAAAFAAAADGGRVGMGHLVRAIAQELDKGKQPINRRDFGPWAALLEGGASGNGAEA